MDRFAGGLMVGRPSGVYRLGLLFTERTFVLALPLVLAAAGAVFAGVDWYAPAPLIPALYLLASFGYAASTAVLLNAATPEDREASRLLAFVFAFSAVATLLLALTTPIELEDVPALDLGLAAPPVIYALWQAALGCFAIAFGRLFRNAPNAPAGATRTTLWIVGVAVVGVLLVLLRQAASLTPVGEFSSWTFQHVVGPADLALCVVGTGLVRKLPRSAINRAFSLSMFAISLEAALVLLGPSRYSAARYIARVLVVLASSSVFVYQVRGLVLDRLRLLEVQRELGRAASESHMHAAQFRALWQAATVDRLGDNEFFQTITGLGSASLRPGYPIYGYVSEFEGDDLVIEAISFCGTPYAVGAGIDAPEFAADSALERRLLEAGTTTIWGGSGPWAAAIGTPITMGTKTHFLIFCSSVPLDERPFSESDVGFVEVLGSLIAHRYYQQDQFARLRYQLEHDSLTGLFNTTQFRKELRLAIARGTPLAVARLNLDRFGEINAAHGHMIGDEVLVEVGAMLRSVDAGDVVARMSGDDFAVIIKGVESEGALDDRLSRYRSLFENPFHTGDRDGTRFLPVTSSFGVALFPRDGKDYEEMMRCSEVSLASSKKLGGGNVVVFSDELRAAEQERGVQRREILEAVVSDAFVLEYQPTFDLQTGGIVGAEALIRWNHPTRGRLLPEAFIALAERDAVIGRLTLWVMTRMFKDLRTLSLPPGFRCYMNVPAHLIDNETFVANLERELYAAPQLQRHIGVEITETEAMRNVEKTIVALQALRRRGVRVAIDDFGTGYSSLAYLKRLPVDMVKLDRAFVVGLPDDPKDVSVTELFLGLTERMGVTSLAEGIETEAQADWLRRHGCAVGQGYLVSPPVALEQLPAFFARAAALPRPRKAKGSDVA